VLRDLRNELVSLDSARKDYGVVMIRLRGPAAVSRRRTAAPCFVNTTVGYSPLVREESLADELVDRSRWGLAKKTSTNGDGSTSSASPCILHG
jgi:hypothetical protein